MWSHGGLVERPRGIVHSPARLDWSPPSEGRRLSYPTVSLLTQPRSEVWPGFYAPGRIRNHKDRVKTGKFQNSEGVPALGGDLLPVMEEWEPKSV